MPLNIGVKNTMARSKQAPLKVVPLSIRYEAVDRYNAHYSNDGYRALNRHVMDARRYCGTYFQDPANADLQVMIALQDLAYAHHSLSSQAVKIAKQNLNNCKLWRALSPNDKRFIRRHFHLAFNINFRTGQSELSNYVK